MAVKGCSKAMKWILIIFNALILIAGAIAIGLGAWGLASEYGAEKIKSFTGSEFYRGGAIAVIVGGCVMVVISIIGFVGALMENRVLLGIYFVILLLLLILFVVATVVAFAYRDTLQENITTQMTNTLLHQYGININGSSDNKDVTNIWNDLQKNLQCCGVKGRLPNSVNSWFLWQTSDWFRAQNSSAKKFVPESCCNLKFPTNSCTSLNNDITKPVQINITTITSANDALYYEGCYDQLIDKVREHILAIGGIALAIVIVMFLCILFSICVCANIGRRKMVV